MRKKTSPEKQPGLVKLGLHIRKNSGSLQVINSGEGVEKEVLLLLPSWLRG